MWHTDTLCLNFLSGWGNENPGTVWCIFCTRYLHISILSQCSLYLRGNDLQSRNTNFIPLVLFNLDTERFPLLPRLMAMFGMRRRWEVTDFNWIVFHRLLRWFRATIKLIKAEQSGRQQIVCQNTGKLENFLHPRPPRLTCMAGVSVILSGWLRPGDYCVCGEQLILCIHLSVAEITLSWLSCSRHQPIHCIV